MRSFGALTALPVSKSHWRAASDTNARPMSFWKAEALGRCLDRDFFVFWNRVRDVDAFETDFTPEPVLSYAFPAKPPCGRRF